MPSIQRPDLIRRIRKQYGIRGSDGPTSLSPEIVPISIVDVATDADPTSTYLCTSGFQQTSAAGTRCHLQLVNPSSSDRLVRVISWSVAATGATNVEWGRYDTSVAGLVSNIQSFIDSRVEGSPVAFCRQNATAAAVVTSTVRWSLTTNIQNELPLEGVTLEPGTAFVVSQFTNGVLTLRGAVIWTEEPNEV